MYPIIGLTGPARSGKSTLAEMLLNDLGPYRTDNGYRPGYIRLYGMAWPLKRIVNELFGWGPEHAEGVLKDVVDPRVGISPREAYQKIGTEFGRDFINTILPGLKFAPGDLWIFRAQHELEMRGRLIVADIRFPNEVAWIDRNGGLLVHVQRAGDYGIGALAAKHSSEAGLPVRNKDWETGACTDLEELGFAADGLIAHIQAQEGYYK